MKQNQPINAAVIGNPVTHSKSPQMHNQWFADCGIAGGYVPIHCAKNQQQLLTLLGHLAAIGFTGVNLTLPFKGYILGQPNIEYTPAATAIGAINTLKFREGTWFADNTDWIGVANSQNDLGDSNSGTGDILVIGAGGAAQAAVYANRERAITITNRTRCNAETLIQSFDLQANVVDWPQSRDEWADLYSQHSLVIQTTSAELLQCAPDWTIPTSFPTTKFLDLAYLSNGKFLSTEWSAWAASSGLCALDGLPMLVYQGAAAFHLWTGQQPDTSATVARLRG